MGNLEWLAFLGFSNRASAEAVTTILESENVPTLIETRLIGGMEGELGGCL